MFTPRMIFWELTDRCNLACIHCRGGDHRAPAIEKELSTVEAKSFIDAVSMVYKPVIVLTGGEPLYRDDVFEIASHIRNRGLRTALATNGTLVNSEIAERIREAGITRVSISIDGAESGFHDDFRGVPGSFLGALDGARALRDAGVEFQFNMTVTRGNSNQMPAVFQLAEKVGAKGLHFFMLVPVGCGVELAEAEMLSPDEYEEILDRYWHLSQETALETKATCAPHYARINSFNNRRYAQDRDSGPSGIPRLKTSVPGAVNTGGSRPPSLGCLAGTAVCFISHIGEVRPCGYFNVAAGNIKDTPFREIWENSPLFSDLREPGKLKGKCGFCEYKTTCGGCRARAFQVTGDFLAEEPFCRYVPPGFEGP